jgi:hypothetical protein
MPTKQIAVSRKHAAIEEEFLRIAAILTVMAIMSYARA